MERNWSIRPYRIGDEHEILSLWKVVHPEREYNREKWLRWWTWQYKENPAGSSAIWIAEDNGKIVGQYALISELVKVYDNLSIIYQSVDTMTHPNYRRQGMFIMLARAAYQSIENNDTHIIFGFPNNQSLPGFIGELNFHVILNIPLIVKPLNWGNFLKLRIKNKLFLSICQKIGELAQNSFFKPMVCNVGDELTISKVDTFDERINDLWEKISDRYTVTVVRKAMYLNWRYAAPDIKYFKYIAEKKGEIVGYLVIGYRPWRENVKVGIIFDIFAETREVTRYLLTKAEEDCRIEKLDLLYTQMKGNKMYATAFRRNGFITFPLIESLKLIVRTAKCDKKKRNIFNDNSKWLIQLGDSDLV